MYQQSVEFYKEILTRAEVEWGEELLTCADLGGQAPWQWQEAAEPAALPCPTTRATSASCLMLCLYAYLLSSPGNTSCTGQESAPLFKVF